MLTLPLRPTPTANSCVKHDALQRPERPINLPALALSAGRDRGGAVCLFPGNRQAILVPYNREPGHSVDSQHRGTAHHLPGDVGETEWRTNSAASRHARCRDPIKALTYWLTQTPLGAQVPRIKVQVKRHGGEIGADGLRSFMALLGDQDVGIYVSTGGFSSGAQREARTQERRRITLVDLEKLFDLWVEHYKDVAEPDKQLLPLRPVYYLAPTE